MRSLIDEDTRSSISKVLRGEGPRTLVRDIVSGPSDADKIDYLKKDSYFAGVEQGRFDYVRFIDQAIAISANPDTLLGFRWEAYGQSRACCWRGITCIRPYMVIEIG